ncbi:MAG: redoxin domain-containing protein [candidate division NC10 bacterium]|nr:redoxin domain-containing protein [candidate division NC10 bacterium]
MQFADFSGHQEQFKEAAIDVVALSVDKEEDARKMVERHRVGFPVVYGLDVRKEAEKIGAYFDSEGGYFQPANFILRNGRVIQVTYSSGPLGRLQAEHVLMLVAHYRKQEKG